MISIFLLSREKNRSGNFSFQKLKKQVIRMNRRTIELKEGVFAGSLSISGVTSALEVILAEEGM